MLKPKINLIAESFSIQQLKINTIIKKCICAVLEAENITARCEINVLVTNDKGIRTINLESRKIDKATDVLSFPMFQLEAGAPPEDWDNYIDPETGMCPLGDMAISLERAVAQAKEFGHSVKREVGYLTIHSIMDHQKPILLNQLNPNHYSFRRGSHWYLCLLLDLKNYMIP